MSQLTNETGLQIPDQMRERLEKFQRQVWTVKLIEGICAAIFGLLVSWLLVFVLDRFYDTSAIARLTILLVGSIGLAIWLPWMCHRWIWKSRRLDQVARMLKVNHPRLGDYLLGIIELVNNDSFEGSSESLCRAALAQADQETARRDFSNAVPHPRHRRWLWITAGPLVLALAALLLVPTVGSNALARWLMPWRDIDRYTFTQVEALPSQLVVPLAEQTEFDATLAESSRWNPTSGAAIIGPHRVDTQQDAGHYRFSLPPIQTPTNVRLRIGDVRENVSLNPQPRPELAGLAATITLPDYLQRSEPIQREIRGGRLSTVAGSDISLTAQATRRLVSATVDGQSVDVAGDSLQTKPVQLDEAAVLELQWKDELGLSAKSPLKLKLQPTSDEAPTLTCRELAQQRVMMVKDVLSFEVDANDDYGLRTIGMEWIGTPASTSAATPAKGETIVYAGNPNATELDAATATFSPQRESIEPQTIALRLFAEDYLPDRERVYSPVYTVFVLSEDEHAIWMTRRLDDWFKQALETYEREQQLYKTNIALRNLSAEEIDRPENRRKIESQATAEKAQARRLNALTRAGEGLVKEAARNDNFGVDHLEKLAEMMQSLKDIHDQRMPSVADMLKQAAQAQASAGKPQSPSNKSSPSVSDHPTNADQQASASDAERKPTEPSKSPPTISMSESNMNGESEEEQTNKPAEETAGGASKLTLPKVVVAALPDDDEDSAACPAAAKMDTAVEAQEELLAEFQKVAEELQKLIANLEGSTFVKRLKAMSRRELVIAKDVNQSTLSGFGATHSKLKAATRDRTKLLAKRQRAHSQTLQHIQDDLDAFINRVQDGKFKTVLGEMQDQQIVKQTQLLADRMVANEPGTSIAHSELLADTFDRWAEQLVGPG